MFKKATLGLVMSFLLFTVGSHIPLSLSASWPTPISGDRGSAIVRTVTEWSGERLAEKGILMSKNCPVGFGATCSPQIAPVPGAVADADILGAGFWAPASPLRAEYIIDCRIDPAKGFLKGTETIRLKNSAEQAISKLIVYRQVREGSSLSISADGKDAIVLQETSYVSQAANYFNGGCPFENYRYTVFDLPEAWQPSKSLDLKVDFSTPIIDANTLYLTEWHPRLYWGYPTHDDFEVKVDLPPGYSLVTSGRFDGKSGRFCANDVRSFGLVFGKNLRVKDASAGDVLVQLLYPPDHEEWAQIVSATAVDAVNFYRQRFGFYPYKNLSIVLGGNFNVGTSISALHDQEFKTKEESENDWKWSTAHEIAHMYWGEYILNREVPTDLSFSTDPVRWCVLSPLMLGMGFRADREYSRARGLVDMKPYHPYEINFRWLIQAFRDCRDSTMSMTAEQQLDIEEWYQNKVLRHGRGSALVSALESLIGSETPQGRPAAGVPLRQG